MLQWLEILTLISTSLTENGLKYSYLKTPKTFQVLHVLGSSVGRALCLEYSVVGSSPTRGSSFFLGKVTALGVLCCFALFVCLTLLASFFLPSHLSFKNMYIQVQTIIAFSS